MGYHSHEGARNLNGLRLIEFCLENSLFIANTVFINHGNIYTWTAPDQKTRNQIDFIFLNCQAYSPRLIATDHRKLQANLNLKLIYPTHQRLQKIENQDKYDITKLIHDTHSPEVNIKTKSKHCYMKHKY